MARILHEADYVFYQSEFCKRSADLFLGKREGGWEILYNAVDTTVFTPSSPLKNYLSTHINGKDAWSAGQINQGKEIEQETLIRG